MADSPSEAELAASQKELTEYLEGCIRRIGSEWPAAIVAMVAVTGQNYSLVTTEVDDPETVASMFRQGAKAAGACRQAILDKKKEARRDRH